MQDRPSGKTYEFEASKVPSQCDVSISSQEYDYEHDMAAQKATAASVVVYDTDDEILNPYDRTREWNEAKNSIRKRKQDGSRTWGAVACGMAMIAIGFVFLIAANIVDRNQTQDDMEQYLASMASSSSSSSSSNPVGDAPKATEEEEGMMQDSNNHDSTATDEEIVADTIEAMASGPTLLQPFDVDDLLEPRLHGIDSDHTYDVAAGTPFVWSIPHVRGGDSLEHILTDCLELTVAGSSHGHSEEDHLALVVNDSHQHYINVDLTTHQGVARACDLQLIPSKMAHVVVSSVVYPTVEVFDEHHNKGTMFALLQDPIDRILAEYQQQETSMSLEKYMEQMTHNYMVRALTNQLDNNNNNNTEEEMTIQDLEQAKDLLESKCLIGLTNFYAASIHRMVEYFGWAKILRGGLGQEHYVCQEKHIDATNDDTIDPPPPFKTMDDFYKSDEFKSILEQNSLDVELFSFAQTLYFQQGGLPAFAH